MSVLSAGTATGALESQPRALDVKVRHTHTHHTHTGDSALLPSPRPRARHVIVASLLRPLSSLSLTTSLVAALRSWSDRRFHSDVLRQGVDQGHQHRVHHRAPLWSHRIERIGKVVLPQVPRRARSAHPGSQSGEDNTTAAKSGLRPARGPLFPVCHLADILLLVVLPLSQSISSSSRRSTGKAT